MLPKVMIVEDDTVIREVYLLKFELEGYEVMGAVNGQEALALLQNFQPDVILLDMMMPIMGGLEFMRRLQEVDQSPQVIVFSNISAPDQMQAVMELGAVDYWIKSDFTPELAIDGIMKRWTPSAS
jgi:CheY-like chemotaxis protein